jgi:hypothetical protein
VSYGETGLCCRVPSRLSQQLFTWRRLARQTAQSAPAILIPGSGTGGAGGCVTA